MIKYFLIINALLYIISIIIIYMGVKNKIRPCASLIKTNGLYMEDKNRFAVKINLFVNPK